MPLKLGEKIFEGGINHIRIHEGGECQATICASSRVVGNFQKKAYNLFELSKPILCKDESCGCIGNDVIPKFRSEKEANDFFNLYVKDNSDLFARNKRKLPKNKVLAILVTTTWPIFIRKVKRRIKQLIHR